MTYFELRESKRVIVHEVVKMDRLHFFDMILNNGKMSAVWCNGLVLFVIPSPTTDAMVEKSRDGEEEHFMAVYFTELEVHTDVYTAVNGLKIALTFSDSKFMTELTTWVKENHND